MQWHTARGLKDGTRDGVVVQRLKRHTMASCATSSKTATMRVVLHGILCYQLSITCVGGSIGFHGRIDKSSIQSWRARCSTMWISGILTWYARHKVLVVCLMSWSICNHECKDPLFGQVSNCQDTLTQWSPKYLTIHD